MKPKLFLTLTSLILLAVPAAAQDSFTRNFRAFKNLVPGVDFYGARLDDVKPFEAPILEARKRLETYLGKDLGPGAIVICSTMDQKDSVSEQRLLKLGYKWALIQLTPEATSQQMLAQVKSQMGGEVPAALLERFKNPSPEMRATSINRLVATTVQRAAAAIIMTTTSPEIDFRSSRLDDMSRSALSDWLDMGLSANAAGTAFSNVRMLQDRLDDTFPLEDLLTMYRPFVAPDFGGGSGGGGGMRGAGGGGGGGPTIMIMGGGPGGGGQGGNPGGSAGGRGAGGGGQRGGGQRGGVLPKDVQDRMTFDAQAATFFAFVVEKLGQDKVVALVRSERGGKSAAELLTAPEMLGPDLEKVEAEWQEWVKARKPEPSSGPMRFISTTGGPPAGDRP